jgi:type II pantothenate kinase
MGAFLRHTPRKRLGSFTENFSQIQKISGTSVSAFGTLETFPSSITPFPLLANVSTYNPDTIDLSDPKAQRYWIDLLDKNLSDLVEMVIDWQGRTESSKSRIASFEAMYRDHLQRLRKEPTAYGVLSVRR